MRRRTYITIGGGALTTALAGCLGGDDDDSSNNDLVEADGGDLLLSGEEISETAPGNWEEREVLGEENISEPVGIDTQDFVELQTEDQTEGLSVIVRVFESIEDAEMFADDELNVTGDVEVQEEDMGDEAYAAYAPESDFTSFFVRQANFTVSVIGTIHVSRLREIAEIQVDEL